MGFIDPLSVWALEFDRCWSEGLGIGRQARWRYPNGVRADVLPHFAPSFDFIVFEFVLPKSTSTRICELILYNHCYDA